MGFGGNSGSYVSPWKSYAFNQDELKTFETSDEAKTIDMGVLRSPLQRHDTTGEIAPAYSNPNEPFRGEKLKAAIKAMDAFKARVAASVQKRKDFETAFKNAPGARAQTVLNEQQNPLGTLLFTNTDAAIVRNKGVR